MSLNLPFSPAFLSGRPYDDHADEAAGLSRLTVHGAAPSPMRYSEARHGTPEAFARSRDGEQYVREVRHTLAGLRDFALTHARHLDADLVCEALQQLEDKITCVEADGHSLLGPRAGCIYNAGKALLDDIGVAMRDERVPLTTRLGALRVLAENATPCVDGMLSQLNHCLSAVNGRHSPLLGLALALSADLLDEAIVQALRQHNVHADAHYARNEIHHVNGLKEVVFPQLGRSFQPDRIARRPSQALVSTCMALVEQVHLPTTLAIAMADRIRARVEADASQQLGIPAEVLRSGFTLTDEARQKLQDITHAMRPEFGELPLDTLMDWNDAEDGSMLARLHRGNTLLALHVLTELHKLGMVDSRALQAFSITLEPATDGHPAVTMKALDQAIFWVEQGGCRRNLTVKDLALPLFGAPFGALCGAPFGAHFGAPSGDDRSAQLQLGPGSLDGESLSLPLAALVDAAIDHSWLTEVGRLPMALVNDDSLCKKVIERLDDDSITAWLCHFASGLTTSQRFMLQEHLVLQRRDAVLQVAQMLQWNTLDEGSTSRLLWEHAIAVGDAGLLDTVGKLLLHVARHSPVDAAGAALPDTWLASLLAATPGSDRHPLTPLFVKPRLATMRAAVDVILTAHDKGLLTRPQTIRALAVGPSIARQNLGTPVGCMVLLATMLEDVHERIELTGDEMLACIGEGAANPMLSHSPRGFSGSAGTFWIHLKPWVMQGRMTMDHWWRLMSLPVVDAESPYRNSMTVKLVLAPPDTLLQYLAAICAAARQGWLTKPELMNLLRAPPAEGQPRTGQPAPSQHTLFWLLSAPGWWSDVAASSQRLLHFFDALYTLLQSGRLGPEDLRLILLEPDRTQQPFWDDLVKPPHHPCRHTVQSSLYRMQAQGWLTSPDLQAMLRLEKPEAPSARQAVDRAAADV